MVVGEGTPAERASTAAPGEAAQAGHADPVGALSEADRRLVSQLRARDQVVRAHEQAHLAAAGNLAAGGASFESVKGPDGRQYAVGGEVRIDTSPVQGDPAATLKKAAQIQRAALAPAQPSAQDLAVAARAAAMAQEAQMALMAQRTTEGATGDHAAHGGVPSLAELVSGQEGSGKTEGGGCAVCGGAHDGGDHTRANTARIIDAVAFTEPAAPPEFDVRA